jgi:hypothetical protein
MTTLAEHRRTLQTPLSYGKADHKKGCKPHTLLTKQALLDQAAAYVTLVGGDENNNPEIVGDGAQRLLRAAYAMTIVARLIERHGTIFTLGLLETRQ